MRRRFFVYVLASRTRRLYVGVTNDLLRRLSQHRTATTTFAASYRITRLVYFEQYEEPMVAIRREKQIEAWRRSKKLALVTAANPLWIDLSEE